MLIKSLRSFKLDETGRIFVNGHEIENVTAFSLTYTDGECGLSISHDVFYKSEVESKKLLLHRHAGEVSK